MKKPLSVRRTLRVKVWNTVEGQSWQHAHAPPNKARSSTEGEENETNAEGSGEKPEEAHDIDLATGEGVPKWTLHIEGMLLDVSIILPNFVR